MRVLRNMRIRLTYYPLLNAVIAVDFKESKILRLLRAGIKVTINSDNSAYFGGYVNENLVKIMKRDITRKKLVRL